MKVTTKKLEKCQVSLAIELEGAEVAAVVKNVEKAFMREVRMPGFRPGKVPLEMIRKNFARDLQQETERSLVRKYYPAAVKDSGVSEVALADVKEIKFSAEGGSFEAILDVKPEFKLPTYKGLKIAAADVTVKDAAVEEQVARLRAAYAKYEDAKEGDAVADGDFVQIDYEGMIGKQKILEINPEAKIVGKGEGFWTQIEEGRFLAEILDALKGMKVGETKEGVKAKFDKETAPEGLKGEKAVYTVTVKALRRRVLPTDAEFVEKAKAESMEKLVAGIRESLEKQAVRNEAARRENDAVELLLKKVDFDVPQSMLQRAINGYLNNFAQQAQYAGLGQEYFEKNQEQIMKDAEATAEKQVRLWYIIDAIAEAEKIEAKDDDKGRKVIEFVLANAK